MLNVSGEGHVDLSGQVVCLIPSVWQGGLGQVVPERHDGGSDSFCVFSFSGEDQVDLSGQVVCLDPIYDILWGSVPPLFPNTPSHHHLNAKLGVSLLTLSRHSFLLQSEISKPVP